MKNFKISWRLDVFCLSIAILLVNVCAEIVQEECEGDLGGSLLAVEDTTVSKYDMNLENPKVLAFTPYPISLDYDPYSRYLYWSDFKSREIVGYNGTLPVLKLIIDRQENWMPYSIAVDSISSKLYVVDSFTNTIHLFDLVEDNHAVVIGTNLTEVKKIALDPYEGYLFVLDKFQIFRTDLDGQNREVIHSETQNLTDQLNELSVAVGDDPNTHVTQENYKALTVGDIAVDTDGKRIYWVDTMARLIESSDYDGKNRKIHFHNETEIVGFESPASLTYFNGVIYWVDSLDKKVIKIDINNDNKVEVILKNFLAIKGIKCKSQEKTQHPCDDDNGGCDQLCISSKSNDKSFRCACNIGYELALDKESCFPVHEFLMFTQANFIRGLTFTADEKNFIDAINPPNFQVGSGTTLDFDAKEKNIYYSSLHPKDQIYQIQIDSREEKLLLPDFLSKSVGRFAYDWITSNLYYFSYYYADMTTLSVMNTKNPTYSKILIGNVTDLIRGIVVEPNSGYLFFAQMNDNYDTISRMALDGSRLAVLVEMNSKNAIDCLALDYINQRLYWSESEKQTTHEWNVKIRHSNLDGKDIEDIILSENFSRLSALVIKEDSIYALTGPNNALIRLDKKGNFKILNLVEAGVQQLLNGLQAFTTITQTVVPGNPCVNDNDCEKFCFTVPNDSLSKRCGCPYGEKLGDDNKSCVNNHLEEPPFIPCENTAFKCNTRTQHETTFGA